MKIVLIGLRGSGKSKIGRLLSEKLGLPLLDLDNEIEKSENHTISAMVATSGWAYFREVEKKIVRKFADTKNVIISPGGGAIIDPENRTFLKKDATVIYLKRLPSECYEWIKSKKNRPSLTGEKDVLRDLKLVYEKRKPVYEKAADIIIERTEDLEKDTNLIINHLATLSKSQ
ncbi:MAG: shikimate kinase [Candidatus Gracilibacteria bacterium]|jgi:shikimate kinase